MRIRHHVSLVALALGIALPAAAQDDVRLLGRVVEDPDARPIEGVHIVARNFGGAFLGQAVTDEHGWFEIGVGTRVGAWLTAERIGYRRAETPFLYFDRHAQFRLEIRLHPDAVLLAPLEVVSRSGVGGSPMFDDLRDRIQSGLGVYFTRTDILERRPVVVSDLLREVTGLTVGGGGTSRRSVIVGRTGCPVQIFLDGMLLTRGGIQVFTVDEVVSPLEVEAIEIYRGLSTVPAEFLNEDADCGVIAIWTHRGG